MPPGLSLNGSTGLITGTPTKPGNYPVTFTASRFKKRYGKCNIRTASHCDSVKDNNSDVADGSNWYVVSTVPEWFRGEPNWICLVGKRESTSRLAGSYQHRLHNPCSLQIYGTPTAAGSYPITVTLTDSLGDTVTQSMTLIVASGPPPQLPAAVLPLATIGTSFSYTFSASGGTSPYTWSFNGNGPDPGLQLSTSGTLSRIRQLPVHAQAETAARGTVQPLLAFSRSR